MARARPDQRRDFVCPKCLSTFVTSQGLVSHLMYFVHENDKKDGPNDNNS